MNLFSNLLFWFVVCLVVLNIFAFIQFGVDKAKAKKGQWRIPENSLFLTALLGGSLGCILGMKVFHHKTKHKSFTIGMPLILVLQIVLIALVWKFI